MKAISLWQPWASAIALGYKRHETRSWPTRHRGPIAIHAAKRWTRDERDWCRHFAAQLGDMRLLDPPRGAIVAVARLVAATKMEDVVASLSRQEVALGNYAPGRHAWRLEDIRNLTTPIPFTGRQGIFEIPDELLEDALSTA